MIWDVLREWVKQRPINQKWLKPEFKVTEILKKESVLNVDFTIKFVFIYLKFLYFKFSLFEKN